MERVTITVRSEDGSTLTIKPKGGTCFIGIQNKQEVGAELSNSSIYLIANALLSIAELNKEATIME